MNILIIENSTSFTGAFRCAVNEASLLSSNHHFVFVIHTKSTVGPLLLKKGIRYHTLPMLEIRKSIPTLLAYPFMLVRNAFALQQIIKKEQIAAVQVNDFYNLLGVCLKIAGFRGKLITYVRFVPSSIPSPLRKLWTWAGQKYSDYVVAVSDTVLKQLPAKENTIRVYDPAYLTETIEEPVHNSETVQLLYLSNYIRGKGQDHALDAFIYAYDKNKNLRLKFAGGDMGLEKNKQFKQLLEEKVYSAGLNNVVTFAAFSDTIELEIKQADIVLNFSNSESLSMTCLEAAYYGTPLIATRCGGPEEIIVHGETGLLVPVADVAAMTAAILSMASDALLRKTYAAAGKIYVREKFNASHFITAFDKLLTKT